MTKTTREQVKTAVGEAGLCSVRPGSRPPRMSGLRRKHSSCLPAAGRWSLSHLLFLIALQALAGIQPAFSFLHTPPLDGVNRQRSRPASLPKLSVAVPDSIADLSQNLLDATPLGDVSDPTILGASAAIVGAGLILPNLLPKGPLISSSTLDAIARDTFLQNKPLTCVYKASRDGWSAVDFHEAVDGRGSGLVVARSRTGQVFGGLNPVGWRSTDDYFSSTTAFLWYQKSANNIVKYPVLSGGNAAIFDFATSGPCFGSQDLMIGPPRAAIMGGFAGPDMENVSTNAGDLRQAKASVGFTYKVDGPWPVRGSFGVSDVEVYCNAQIGRQ